MNTEKRPNLLVSLLGWIFRGFRRLHARFPLTLAGIWVGLLSLLIITRGIENHAWTVVVLGLIPAGLYVAFVVRYGAKIRLKSQNKQWLRSAYIAFESTRLWDDFDIRQWVEFEILGSSFDLVKAKVRTPSGRTDEDVIRVLPIIKSFLQLKEAIVLPDEDVNDGRVTILLGYVSPLEIDLPTAEAPVLHMDCSDPLAWIPVGVSANGDPMEVPLFLKDQGSMRMLHSGASGSGKSSVITQQLLYAVKCPHIDVVVTDGKGGSEFGAFKDHVQSFAVDKAGFFDQLRFLEAEVARRSKVLGENKTKNPERFSASWNHIDDGPYLFWVWDELGRIFAQVGNDSHEVNTRIFGIVSVARSLGIAVAFSSQTFKASILPTETRDGAFNGAIGYKMNTARDAAMVGFEPEDAVSPVNIKGTMLKTGSLSSAGVFALRGIGHSRFGRSYYLTAPFIGAALQDLPPVTAATSNPVSTDQ